MKDKELGIGKIFPYPPCPPRLPSPFSRLMSQKNELKVLILSLLITLGVLGGGLWWWINWPPDPRDESSSLETSRLSWGEKSLIKENSSEKQTGIQAIAEENFFLAVSQLEASLKKNPNDPEAVIFLNNAKIGNQKSYAIAASVPLGSDINGALEILRGVAQAQKETNETGGINRVPLKVVIANDDNDPETAKQIASTLAEEPQVLGVVGPYASDVTLVAGTVYNSQKLVTISPISTSVKLSGFSPYVFRTVPSDYVAARALADYMLTKLSRKSAIVYFNSESGYSQSLKSEFVTAVALGGGQVSGEFDLSDPNFNAFKSVEQAIQQGAEVIMLAPNTGTLDKALQVVQVNNRRLLQLGGDDVYTPKTLEIGGQAAVDMVLAVPWHIAGNSQSDFPRLSRQLWGADVNWRTALAYDAAKALIAAIERTPTRTGVQQALSASDFSTVGASGTVRFLPSGDRNASIQLVKIVPGKRSGTGYDFVPESR